MTKSQDPKTFIFCPVCTIPFEFCEYGSSRSKCRLWLKENRPEDFAKLNTTSEDNSLVQNMQSSSIADDTTNGQEEATSGAEFASSKPVIQPDEVKNVLQDSQIVKEKKSTSSKTKKIVIKTEVRSRKKVVTVITNLGTYKDLDMKKVTKKLATKFACGVSTSQNASGEDEVVVQGDVTDSIVLYLLQEFAGILRESFFKMM